jgi:hypothetical protein
MGLGALLTKLFEPCRSAPKSPPCPSPDKNDTEQRAAANATDKTIVEVLPCGDVTNKTPDPSSSPKPISHAKGFSVNQVKVNKTDSKPKASEEDNEVRDKLILEVFGFEIHRLLNSKAWDDRAQAIAGAREKCNQREIPASLTEATFLEGCCKLVLVCLQDKVMPIYFEGLEFIKFLFAEFFPQFDTSSEVIKAHLEELLPLVIAKTADRNARSNEGTRDVLTFLARCNQVGCSPVMAHIFSPIVNHKEISAIRGRLELIDHMIGEFGFSKNTTITMQLVMGFVRPHLDATDEKVRRAAIEVTVNCYKHKGDRTLKYITNVKPALLKLLQQRFAELDQPGRNRKHTKSAQGLPAVRGPRKAPRKRESASQPCAGTANQSFFSGRPAALEPVAAPTGIESVLQECPQLFGMGNNSNNTMVMSPLSSQAAPSNSIRDDLTMITSPEPLMPGALGAPQIPGAMGDPMEGLRMGEGDPDLDELDADLMNEIESY